VAVAVEENPDDVRPWTEGITYPVLIDREHELAESYAITNVPTVLWIDEDDRIARPNGVAVGTDIFKDFTGVESGPHKDAIRRWVREGEVDVTPEEAHDAVGDLTDEQVQARLRYRLALHLLRNGRDDAARKQFDEAGRLAPNDFIIRRAAMPLVGDDPFGEKFFELWNEWQEAGMPFNGLGRGSLG